MTEPRRAASGAPSTGAGDARPDARPDARAESRVAARGARMLLFEVGGRIYACGIDAVREIIPFRRITRLPGAPSFVCGLINLRGTIVTVLDLGVKLDPSRAPARRGSILIGSAGTRLAGVVVDEVMDVRPVVDAETRAPGDTLDGVLRGLGHSAGQVVILIDVLSLVKHVLL